MIAQKQTHFSYDNYYDILYVDIGEPCFGYNEEVSSDIYLRLCDDTDKLVGFTIISFKEKDLNEIKKIVPLKVNWQYILNGIN